MLCTLRVVYSLKVVYSVGESTSKRHILEGVLSNSNTIKLKKDRYYITIAMNWLSKWKFHNVPTKKFCDWDIILATGSCPKNTAKKQELNIQKVWWIFLKRVGLNLVCKFQSINFCAQAQGFYSYCFQNKTLGVYLLFKKAASTLKKK